MPDPPRIAELILRGLLPLDMGETVSGDLLEEYRESRVPAGGEFRADLWYWRQVSGMWLRANWWLVMSAILLQAGRAVFNTFRAPSGAFYLDGLPTIVVAVLSPLSPFALVGVVGLATAYGSWRAERWQGGLMAALTVSAVEWVLLPVWGIATFPRAMSWDDIAAMISAGFVLLVTSMFFGGIAAVIGEIIVAPAGARGRRIIRHALLGLGVVSFVLIGLLVGPRAVPPAEVALWAATGGPPLDFEAPHDGQVIAHMDLMGGVPPNIARIRISELASGATVWDVKPTRALRVCWNGCWNLTLKAGSNPASFAAGRQQFNASAPKTPTFSLTRGKSYLFEVWDSKGRVQRRGFTL